MCVGKDECYITVTRNFVHDNPSYHIFGFTETYLGHSVDGSVVNIDKYHSIRKVWNVPYSSSTPITLALMNRPPITAFKALLTLI